MWKPQVRLLQQFYLEVFFGANESKQRVGINFYIIATRCTWWRVSSRTWCILLQVALRNFLGDPWPRMVLHPGGNSAEDRMTLIEAINEATRMGSGFGHKKSQEAQRYIFRVNSLCH
jgi:hypothetical protein